MKIKYIDKNFNKASLELIELANSIIDNYRARGYDLTLRQLYYQLVAKDLIPNTEKSYNRLGGIISNARDAGMIDWLTIVDRTRSPEGLSTWDDGAQILRAVANQFRIDKWENQRHQVSVWVEKEALAGVIATATTDENIQVDYLSCRGYMSSSTIWREGIKIQKSLNKGKIPVIIHLGDHDPSGIDMTRDNIQRLALYAECDKDDFIFRRIALNWDQIKQYNPPPNPTKLTDTRANAYIEEYGYESWELDALDPDVLVSLIRNTINEYKDEYLWEIDLEREKEEKDKLILLSRQWEDLNLKD